MVDRSWRHRYCRVRGIAAVRLGFRRDPVPDLRRNSAGSFPERGDRDIRPRDAAGAHAAARHRLPAIYGLRNFVLEGGLLYYGVDTADLYYRTASYVHLILSGTDPADLPVQRPTKFECVINLKTAKALGLAVPNTLLTIADDVIE